MTIAQRLLIDRRCEDKDNIMSIIFIRNLGIRASTDLGSFDDAGFAIMEHGNGTLCWTGRIAEADSDLHRRSGRKDRARRGGCSDPETITAFIKSYTPHVARIGLETGATSTWLLTELNKMALPIICIDARHAKAALKMQINKSDRNDAAGIARIMQCGWYKEVRVKDLDSHAIKAVLVSRALLVKISGILRTRSAGSSRISGSSSAVQK
jgi:hypothetical protein